MRQHKKKTDGFSQHYKKGLTGLDSDCDDVEAELLVYGWIPSPLGLVAIT